MSKVEVRFSGFGGQGIILAGYISGKAATLFDKRNATLTQSYGPESRGGACSAELIVSDETILYPHLICPDVLVAMSQPAYEMYKDKVSAQGILVVDSGLVEPGEVPAGIRLYSIPATRLADEMGRSVVANIIMLGFFTAVSAVITEKSMREAILSSVPAGTEELNTKAFDLGFNRGKEALQGV